MLQKFVDLINDQQTVAAYQLMQSLGPSDQGRRSYSKKSWSDLILTSQLR